MPIRVSAVNLLVFDWIAKLVVVFAGRSRLLYCFSCSHTRKTAGGNGPGHAVGRHGLIAMNTANGFTAGIETRDRLFVFVIDLERLAGLQAAQGGSHAKALLDDVPHAIILQALRHLGSTEVCVHTGFTHLVVVGHSGGQRSAVNTSFFSKLPSVVALR